jgi:hypothetical protein
MRAEHEAVNVVRAELCRRVEALRRCPNSQRGREFTESMLGIRRLAEAYGLTPVVRVSEALQRSAGACPAALYLDRLRDAIGCERLDEQASQAMIASVSVRLA